MGGSEFGELNEDQMRQFMLLNRKAALQDAWERSQRFSAIFRRSRVFETTFERALNRSNSYIGIPEGATLGLPEEYYDPYAVIQFPTETPASPPERGFTPDYDLESGDVFERSSFYDD